MMFILSLLAQTTTNNSTAFPWTLIILGLISSGILTTGLNLWFSRRKTSSDVDKTDAEAADLIQKAAGELIKQIREQASLTQQHHDEQTKILIQQNEDLSNQVRESSMKLQKLEKDVAELSLGIQMLTAQLREHGIDPAFPPMPPAIEGLV